MNRLSRKSIACLFGVAVVVLGIALWLRSPGLDLRDGRNDRAQNGIALDAPWSGGDAGPSVLEVGEFARAMREHRIAELYLQLPPPNADGALTGIDPARVEALLYECYDARGWAQINLARAPYDDPRWRRFFIVELRRLLDRLPRIRGVQLDLSQIPDVSPALLTLLDELRPALAPDTRPLSIAVASWQEPYFREVVRRADQVIVPLDIPASSFARFSVARNVQRISDTLAWSVGKPVLFRAPSGKRTSSSLQIIHLGLARQPVPDHYRGIILEAGPGAESAMWSTLRERFLRP